MIVSDRFGIRQMVYNPNVADLQVTIDKRAYDVSYMVDTAAIQKILWIICRLIGAFTRQLHRSSLQSWMESWCKVH